MKAVIINPSLDAASAIVGILNHSRTGDVTLQWLSHYYPRWSPLGKVLNLEARPKRMQEGTDSMLLLGSPSEEAAEKFSVLAIPQLYVFHPGEIPAWARAIKAGDPPLWAQTLSGDNFVAKEIEVVTPGTIAPRVRQHLH